MLCRQKVDISLTELSMSFFCRQEVVPAARPAGRRGQQHCKDQQAQDASQIHRGELPVLIEY
jgi:hypothetical protein